VRKEKGALSRDQRGENGCRVWEDLENENPQRGVGGIDYGDVVSTDIQGQSEPREDDGVIAITYSLETPTKKLESWEWGSKEGSDKRGPDIGGEKRRHVESFSEVGGQLAGATFSETRPPDIRA